MSTWERTIVMDNGSGVCKAGFAGDDLPSVIFPSVVGEPKLLDLEKELYVGEEVAPLQGGLKVRYPLANGKVERWDDMIKIWDHAFFQLNVEPSHHPVLLTEPPLNPLKNRERMTEIMFETYRVPALFVQIQAVLALYASGRTTGVVLDAGDGVTHTVPIFEGYAMQHAVQRLNIAGRDLTEYLQRLLLLRGYSFTTSAEFELVKLIKEKLCFVKPNSKDNPPRNAALKGRYELPGGDVVRIFEERYLCPEALFTPSLVGKEAPGIHELVNRTISACDIDLRKDFYQNIILSGGTTTFPGLADRLQAEIQSIAPQNARVKVTAPPERKFSVWIGGSVLGNLETFTKQMITDQEYYEQGSIIIHRKCF